MRLQIGIWRPVPPRIFVTDSDQKKTIVPYLKQNAKIYILIVGLLVFWTSGIREQRNNNLMAAAKRVANDLMPFWLKKLGNDLMSFFSKEQRLDRLASNCTLRSQSKKIRCSIVYLHSLKRTRTYKQTHRCFTNKHTAVKTALLHLYIGRLSTLCTDNYLTSNSIFDCLDRAGLAKIKTQTQCTMVLTQRTLLIWQFDGQDESGKAWCADNRRQNVRQSSRIQLPGVRTWGGNWTATRELDVNFFCSAAKASLI